MLNHLPISAYNGVLKFDMKIFVTVARLKMGQLFTQSARRRHPCTLDTFLVCFFLGRLDCLHLYLKIFIQNVLTGGSNTLRGIRFDQFTIFFLKFPMQMKRGFEQPPPPHTHTHTHEFYVLFLSLSYISSSIF